jgi:hypothetical protein
MSSEVYRVGREGRLTPTSLGVKIGSLACIVFVSRKVNC